MSEGAVLEIGTTYPTRRCSCTDGAVRLQGIVTKFTLKTYPQTQVWVCASARCFVRPWLMQPAE